MLYNAPEGYIKSMDYKTYNRQKDIKILSIMIGIFLFIVWLCTPPGNKFAQLCFYGNNTKYFIANIINPEAASAHKFHHNNAVYLVDMKRDKMALRELNKAILALPVYESDKVMYKLYKDRALVNMKLGNYKAALNDYLRCSNLSIQDRLRIALLFKLTENNKKALEYCNSIVNIDYASYPGFACIADVYANVGKYDTSIRVYDLLIDRTPNKPRYYVERAAYKKITGDIDGYNEDIAKAKEILPNIDTEYSIINDTLHPKSLKLEKL